MNQRKKAFTLIELLIVIFILGILAAMLIIGIKGMVAQGQIADTKTRLQTLQALEQNLVAAQEIGNIQAVYGGVTTYNTTPITAPNPNIASFITIQSIVAGKNISGPQALPYGGGYSTAIINTQKVVAQMLRVSDNSIAFYKYPPSNMAALLSSASNDPPALAPGPPILVDAWGYPIIFCPGAGVFLPNATIATQAPDKNGFWISSGPDGAYTAPLYSFVNQN